MRLPIEQIKLNPDNPRFIKDHKFKKLVQSIKDFPEMTEVREVVVNKEYMILGGNMRYQAMKEAGWTEIPVKIVDWPEDKQREFVIKDNVSGGEWDWDKLANEWDIDLLKSWAVDVPNFGDLSKIGMVNGGDEWVGMPDFEPKDESLKVIIHFESEEDRSKFQDEYKLNYMKKEGKAWSTWYPFKDRDDLNSLKYE